MSCRPAVMPTTKSYIVRRLDSTEQEVSLLKKATGSECLDKVCKSLGILEKDYFGLRYLDKNGEYLWINLRNPLHEQLVPGNRPVMDMRVKYFIRPQKILQPVTRLHFYRQLKKDLIQGRIKPLSLNRAARLTALITQIEKGDYRVGTEYPHKVLSQTDNDTLEGKIRREHQKIAGTSSEVAIEKFLEEASQLDLYGVELYHVLDNRRARKLIGVGPESVQILSNSMESLNRFTYSSIQYTAFHAKKFTALVNSPTNTSGHPEQVDFDLQSRASAQALYRSITEFHTFFKREAVSRVVKTAGFCKSLLGNFKGQNPDRFYFDVMKTHREVIDHVWSILHPSTRIMHGNNEDNSNENLRSSSNNGSSSLSSPSRPGGGMGGRRSNRNHHNHRSSSNSFSGPPRGSGGIVGGNRERGSQSSLSNPTSPHHHHNHSVSPASTTTTTTTSTTTINTGQGNGDDPNGAPPLPPPSRHMQRSVSMGRSRSVQDSGLRPPNFQHLPPLPPYSQRSCSSDILLRGETARRSLRSIPHHGPYMASTATFYPYGDTPSISENGSEDDEETYGGSECYVTMSSRSEATYLPSTRSDPGARSFPLQPQSGGSGRMSHNLPPSSLTASETSGAPSDLYMTSLDSECSGASYRANSPPPLYREVDDEHSVPINFDPMVESISDSAASTTTGGGTTADDPNFGGISLVSPIIPIPDSDSGSAVFNFDAAAVLTRTRELEGELQRLRTAMTCRLCKQNPIGATFCPCGHTVCCYQCAQRMHSCWECDETVTSVQRMLLTR